MNYMQDIRVCIQKVLSEGSNFEVFGVFIDEGKKDPNTTYLKWVSLVHQRNGIQMAQHRILVWLICDFPWDQDKY